MRLITREEMDQMPWRGRGHSSKVYRGIIALEVGQILFIEPQDWGKRKYPPSAIARYLQKRYKRKYKVLRHAANQGWAVERLE